MTGPALLALAAGSLVPWLAVIPVVAIFAAAFVVWRGGGGTALATLETANRILEGRVHELERLRHDDQTLILELRAKTDVAVALAPLIEWSIGHETRAQERHQATLTVLNLIAGRMGPDPNGT